MSLTWSTADINTVREKGRYNHSSDWEGTRYDIATTGDGELTSMVTVNNNNYTRIRLRYLLYTRYNNEREKINLHSNNKPIETTKEYNCDLNVHKLVYRGVTGIYEISLWPTACPRWDFAMDRRKCYKTRKDIQFEWPRAIIILLYSVIG